MSGCAVSGKSLIHSPSADGAMPIKHFSHHGGATKNAPPDAVLLAPPEDDSIEILVQAQRLKDQNQWAGIGIPIFPVFFFPSNNHYEDSPNSLIVRFSILSDDSLTFNSDSITLRTQGNNFSSQSSQYKGEAFSNSLTFNPKTDSIDVSYAHDGFMYYLDFIELKFPVDAFEVDTFQLIVDGIYKENKKLSFPIIEFKKTNQRFFYMGP